MGEGSDEAWIAELVHEAVELAPSDLDIISADWCDLGEVTIVTSRGTFRGTFVRLGDDE
jgi:hypothetical protein